ncbi:MAG: SpoIIE family protein phosphatase [Spirochaetales bacterium]|nr:SpoIIE family protein phosphatase [Spirochaetales bacterium]
MAKISMKTRVLAVSLPIAILPIIIITSIFSKTLFNKLEDQSKTFNTTILTQVANNIDFIYRQYSMSFTDIVEMDNFKKLIGSNKFSSAIEESKLIESLGEISANPSPSSITRNATSKFQGAFFISELDKPSLLRNTDNTLYSFSITNNSIDIKKLVASRMFDEAFNSGNNLIFGKPEDGIITGYDSENLQMFLYLYKPEENMQKKDINKLLFLVTQKNFLPDLYKDIDNLKYGTLYILDQFNNILSYNHPSFRDDYDYDEEKKAYVLHEEDPFYLKEEKIGFNDYKLLNTDPKILNIPRSKEILSQLGSEDFDVNQTHSIRYKGINYLVCSGYASFAKTKLVYFQPKKQIYGPIYNVLFWIIISSFVIVIAITIISIFFSQILTNPINKLAETTKRISKGNYKLQIKTRGFFGEFTELAQSFNNMVKMIDDYNENLEEQVRNRTEELNKKNIELERAYEENKKELAMAQKIQTSLIPNVFPETKKLSFHGLYLPMETIGGDLYDVHQISENKWGIVILDVCGHGVPAALITTMAKISFNANSKKYFKASEVIAAVNNELCEAIQDVGDYFTAFYCIIDTNTHTIDYVNAAHNDLYILRSDTTLETMVQTGPVVGVIKNLEYPSETINFSIGDRLVMYTDGVIEARNEHRELYDSDRLKEMIIANKDKDLRDFVTIIYDDILKFKNNAPDDDDIAMLAIDMNK